VSQGLATYEELGNRFDALQSKVEHAFDLASQEAKPDSRVDMIARNSAPLWSPSPSAVTPDADAGGAETLLGGENGAEKGRSWMRKHMTSVLAEALEQQSDVLYIGEDVMHGGYYLVTDGTSKVYSFFF